MLSLRLKISFVLFGVWSCFSVFARDLQLSVAHIPLLSEYDKSGPYISLMRELDEHYPEGNFHIEVFPFARSLKNVVDGQADMHIPMIRSPYIDYDEVPYQLSTESTGIVCFVIYSNIKKPVTRDMLFQVSSDIKVDTIRGIQGLVNFPFDIQEISEIDHGLKRVAQGRVDAFLFAQEETDYRLNALALRNVRREPLDCFEDVIVLPKSEEGDRLDQLLSEAIVRFRKRGKLAAARETVHREYQNWQPGERFPE